MTNWLTHGAAVLTGLVPAMVMYLIGTQKKVLGYAILRNEPLINFHQADIVKRLAVTLDGKPIAGGRTMEIGLQNLGMKDIESQSVQLTFPPTVGMLHVHCSSPLHSLDCNIDALSEDSYRVHLPLMNPGDKVVVDLLMIGNECGKIGVTAKGLNLKFRRFHPPTFISPLVNRALLVMSGIIFVWILWACVGTDRFMAKPFWEKTIQMVLISFFLAFPASVLTYQGMIPLLKKALQWRGKASEAGTQAETEVRY